MENQCKLGRKNYLMFLLIIIVCVFSLKLFDILPSEFTVEPTAESREGSIFLSESDFPSPVRGPILLKAGNYYSEEFNDYLFHAGTDYAEPEGTVIRITYGGKVIYAGPDYLLGQKVVIDCGQEWLITYGGLENLRVNAGDRIEKNAAIGQVGYYPESIGVHSGSLLHYEIRHGDEVRFQN